MVSIENFWVRQNVIKQSCAFKGLIKSLRENYRRIVLHDTAAFILSRSAIKCTGFSFSFLLKDPETLLALDLISKQPTA